MGLFLVVFIIGASTLALAQLRRQRANRSSRLPPGPPGIPFFGNTFQIAPVHPWKQFRALAQQYGPVMRLQLGRQRLIVISSYEAAQAILVSHAGETASRPRQHVASDLVSGGMRLLFIPHGARWRLMRRALHAGLSIRAAESYAPLQEAESAVMLYELLNTSNPERCDPADATRRFTVSVITSSVYGRRSVTGQETIVQNLYIAMGTIARLGRPGANLVESVPWLEHLPTKLAPWRREALDAHHRELTLFRTMYDRTRADGEDGPPCFAKEIAEKQTEMGLNDNETSYLLGSLFGAGSDTTAGSILSLIQLLVENPEAQRKAQAEIDTVVGTARLPVVADIPGLPYVRGCVKEALRLRPVTTGGSPHLATSDIEYRGYLIPAGSVVQGNHWAINRDPTHFPDPEAFIPERWKGDGSMEEGMGSFGYGRRVCPGQHVAVRSIFVVAARLLFAFNMSHGKDDRGNDIPIDPNAYTNGFNSVPLPFPISLKPRDKDRAALIRAEHGRALAEVSKYGTL